VITTFRFARIQVTISVWNNAGARRLPSVSSFLSGTLLPAACRYTKNTGSAALPPQKMLDLAGLLLLNRGLLKKIIT